jgi:lipopolysaccharide/colanic/teichoic acid biosynthesis glycosyltransferase
MSGIIKRAIDIFVSTSALVLLAPLMATIALSIWLSMGPLVLFRQKRAGYKGCIFTLLKFRTMQEMRDTERQLLPDKDRLTKVGILLRRFSLDELPQFWNVWKGEMSLVGPRPLLVDYLPRYSPEQARRHEVKPGVTGWAQVNGRNALSWDERFELDVWYVDNRSLGLDTRILWKTIRKVFQREGISLDGHATMPEFTGNNQRAS